MSTLKETRLRILYLEDEPDDAELALRTLTAAGFDCEMLRVETRAQFEAALNHGGVDLILSDKTLPQFDGLSALALAREKSPEVPFIFVSGTLGEEAAIESLKNGATDYVLKQRLSRLAPVTQRALTEAAERRVSQKTEAERRRLSAAVECAAEAVVITDLEGRIEYVNPAFEQITGYHSAEVIGQNPRILQSGAQDDVFYHAMWDTLARGQIWRGLLVNRKRDGSTYRVEETISPVTDVSGQIVNYVAVQHDVTRRVDAEDALRASEQRFRALIEHRSDGITLVDAQGTIVYTAPSALRLLGYPDAEFVGRNLLEFTHPDDRPIAAGWFAELLQEPGRMVSGQSRILHRDGSWRWMEITSTNLLHEPSVAAVVVNARDVTQRKQAEEALRQSEEKYRLLVEQIQDVIYAVDERGMITYISPRVEAYTGYTPIDLAGQPFAPFIHPDDLPRVRADFANSLGGKSEPHEYRVIDQSGAIHWARSHAYPITHAGRIVGVQGVLSDVTERKQADAQIQRHLQHLAALRRIDMAISSSLDLRVTLNVLLEQVTEQLQADATAVLLLNPHSLMLEFAAGRGFRSRLVERTLLRLGDTLAGRVALDRTLVTVRNLNAAELPPALAELLNAENFVSYVGVPLIAKGQVKGILEIWQRQPLATDGQWLNFLEALAGQAAIAIDDAQLLDGLQRSNTELSLAYETTIEGWSRALDLRDKETEGHTQRVTELTLRLAREMGLSETELIHVRHGALLHDIGKMGVPDAILLKPGDLTADEWAIMQRHPALAYDLLSPIAYLQRALAIPYCHHEKWDGSGYPRGLKGEQIPLAARIFAVVDVWDALRSDRPYRAAWPAGAVREYIGKQSGTHFDAAVVATFLRLRL